MTWVGRGVCGAALLPATQGSMEAGTWPAWPFLYNTEAGHQGRAEGQVATWSIVRSALPPTPLPVPSFVSQSCVKAALRAACKLRVSCVTSCV